MYCHSCGFLNPEDSYVCLNCGSKLAANTSPRFGNLQEFDNDNVITQVISKFENNFSELFDELEGLRKKVGELEHDVVFLRNGLTSLVDILADKRIIKQERFSHTWENNIISDLKKKEELERFQEHKEPILLVFRGKNRKAFEKLLKRAEDLVNSGNIENGIEILEAALKKNPDNYRLAFYIGQSLYMRGELKKSLKFFQKAWKIHKDDYDTNLYLGLIYNDIGDPQKAVEFFNSAIEISPDFYLPYFSLGTIFYFEENFNLAEFFLSIALEKEVLPEVLFFMGLLKKDQGQKRKAEKYFLKAIEIDPDFEDAYYYLGMIYLSSGWVRKARNMLEKVQHLNPSKLDLIIPDSLHDLGEEWVERNDQVRKMLRKCEIFAKNRDFDLAAMCCRNVVKAEPENMYVNLQYSIYLAEAGRLGEAVLYAEKVIESSQPERVSVIAYGIKHNHLRANGEYEEAVKLMFKMVERFKSDYTYSLAYTNIAQDCIEMDQIGDAEDYAKEAVKKAPRVLRHLSLDALAWVNYKKGNLHKAYDLLTESLSISSANPVAVYHLGIVMLAMKKTEDSEKMFKRLLELREEGSPFPPQLLKSIKEHLGTLRAPEDIEEQDEISTTEEGSGTS